MEGNMLMYEGPEHCDECKEGKKDENHCARYSIELNQDSPMFEVSSHFTLYAQVHKYKQTNK